MKAFYILAALLPAALADQYRACACQQESGSGTFVDSATTKCCTMGKIANMKDGGFMSDVRFPGNYCDAGSQKIGGADFFNCCTQNGAKDSACVITG